MPIYEYKCPDCKSDFEVFQKMSDDPIKVCLDPACGCGNVFKVISAPNFKMSSTSPDAGQMTRDFHGIGRGDSGKQIFTSPFTGEDLDVSGSKRDMQNVVANHYQAHGQEVAPEDVEPTNK